MGGLRKSLVGGRVTPFLGFELLGRIKGLIGTFNLGDHGPF